MAGLSTRVVVRKTENDGYVNAVSRLRRCYVCIPEFARLSTDRSARSAGGSVTELLTMMEATRQQPSQTKSHQGPHLMNKLNDARRTFRKADHSSLSPGNTLHY
jgi:translation initiation factor 2B subunit (eIF-2B alpha/beta/delta family)